MSAGEPAEDALLWLHATALFELDGRNRLLRTNEPDPEAAPRMFVARGRSTSLALYRADIPAATVETCDRLVSELPAWRGRPSDPALFEPLREALAGGPGDPIPESGPAFRFVGAPDVGNDWQPIIIDASSAELLERHFPYTRANVAALAPVVGVAAGDAIVSVCFCARRSRDAAEAGVFTVESHRGRGMAASVVAAWRAAVERESLFALYSTSWSNPASLAVASQLGLHAYAETLSLT